MSYLYVLGNWNNYVPFTQYILVMYEQIFLLWWIINLGSYCDCLNVIDVVEHSWMNIQYNMFTTVVWGMSFISMLKKGIIIMNLASCFMNYDGPHDKDCLTFKLEHIQSVYWSTAALKSLWNIHIMIFLKGLYQLLVIPLLG